MFNISKLIRENVKNMAPYSCARDEFKGEARVFVDANESPYNNPYNRYPDPLQIELKTALSPILGAKVEQIMLGNGSDEPIDLLYRAFCEPKTDNVVAMAPTYGMYVVCANINCVEYRSVNCFVEENKFLLDEKGIINQCDNNTKIIWLCSPNNPTGNLLEKSKIEYILQNFNGIVVVDEAYIDFANEPSFASYLEQYPNLVILRTFSKAFGCAAIRLGMAFASKEIIDVLNKIKYPYNVNLLTQQYALERVKELTQIKENVAKTIKERERVTAELLKLDCVKVVYPSDANFILVKFNNATLLFDYLKEEGIITRLRSSVTLCEGTIRITIGSQEENNILLEAINSYKQ